MKSHQTEGGGVAGTTSGDEGGEDDGEGEGGGGKTQNSPNRNDLGCDPSKPDCIFVTQSDIEELEDLFFGLGIFEGIFALIIGGIGFGILPAFPVGTVIGLVLIVVAIELGAEAFESGVLVGRLDSIYNSMDSTGGITIERFANYGIENLYADGYHFQGSPPGTNYGILGLVNKYVMNNWFNNHDK